MKIARRRRSRRALARWAWPLSLAIAAPLGQAAAYLPGPPADPPTGDAAPSTPGTPEEPLRGSGIDWRFAPWRSSGTLGLDLRLLRFESGATSRQAALLGDVESASYLWQPWFVQVRLGAGFVASTDSSHDDGLPRGANVGNALTARAQLSVFPASRFPFTARAETTDSRTSADALGNDFRTRRLSLSQAFRPLEGNDHYQLQFDVSHLLTDEQTDKLVTLSANAFQLRGPQRFELGFNLADNRNSADGARSRLAMLTGRHAYNPSAAFGIDSLASWHEQRTRYDEGAQSAVEFGSEVRQLSTLLTWRPRQGDLPIPVSPSTLLVGSARWVESRALGSFGGGTLASLNATLGLSTDLSASWRVAGALSANQFDAGGNTDGPTRTASVNASAQWAPRSTAWGDWRWAPSLTLNGGLTRGDDAAERESISAQFGHSLTRDWLPSPTDRLSLTASQSVGWLLDRSAVGHEQVRTLTHSLGVMWQGASDTAQQRFASANVSDYRSQDGDRIGFQLANLQWSQRTQLSRLASWSGHLTLQASRNRNTQIMLDSGSTLTLDEGWQTYASGTVSAEHQRAFGVPRLRFTLLAGVSSQQLQRRSLGDIDAPPQHVSRSIEARLDHQIGRLESRLSVRAARIDDRSVASLVARLQRRF